MRVLVCGPRDMTDYWLVFEVLDGIHKVTPVTCLIEGGAYGADRFSRRWAVERGVPFITFEADWKAYFKAAGPIRNGLMLSEGKPDRAVAFIADPPTPGTADMVRRCHAIGLPTLEVHGVEIVRRAPKKTELLPF